MWKAEKRRTKTFATDLRGSPRMKAFSKIRANPCKSVAKTMPKNKYGPGQPPGPYRYMDLKFCQLTARSSESMAPARQRSLKSAAFADANCSHAVRRNAQPQPLREPAAQPAQRAGFGGGRNARATGMRSRAFPISPGNSPSRIAGCHQRHRKHRSAIT